MQAEAKKSFPSRNEIILPCEGRSSMTAKVAFLLHLLSAAVDVNIRCNIACE